MYIRVGRVDEKIISYWLRLVLIKLANTFEETVNRFQSKKYFVSDTNIMNSCNSRHSSVTVTPLTHWYKAWYTYHQEYGKKCFACGYAFRWVVLLTFNHWSAWVHIALWFTVRSLASTLLNHARIGLKLLLKVRSQALLCPPSLSSAVLQQSRSFSTSGIGTIAVARSLPSNLRSKNKRVIRIKRVLSYLEKAKRAIRIKRVLMVHQNTIYTNKRKT